jgi:hypothetical protein
MTLLESTQRAFDLQARSADPYRALTTLFDALELVAATAAASEDAGTQII